jgi:glyoxylase-like metal-dependent hydrolase (beta-lactamase superfamily II)
MIVHRVPVRGTNCYLLQSAAGIVVVDPGPVGGGSKVVASAEALGMQPDGVRLIFVTHGHLDHYGAVTEVKAWSGAPVAAQAREVEFSRDRRNALPPAQTVRGSVVRGIYLLFSPLARFRLMEVDLFLDDGADLSPYGLDAQAVLLPGHSPASLGILTAEGDLLAGDLFVNFTVPSQPLYLWDRLAWQRSCEQVRALEPRTVYVGHGEPFPGAALDAIHPARYQLRWWVR